ncbi:hypothetical protein [Streptomyces sp. HUAS ZL42]|uniref:hypothetical protein n=1 Tax=Streptomyces sp. HUAS ZL42 TaxID=3231715 RepID=UPI00345E74CB
MAEAKPVTWSETARVLAWCSAVCGATWAVLALSGERQLPVAAPVMMLLARWFCARHRRRWGAGATAALSGAAAAFILVDGLRPHMDRLVADTLATEAGAAVALVVVTACSRIRGT